MPPFVCQALFGKAKGQPIHLHHQPATAWVVPVLVPLAIWALDSASGFALPKPHKTPWPTQNADRLAFREVIQNVKNIAPHNNKYKYGHEAQVLSVKLQKIRTLLRWVWAHKALKQTHWGCNRNYHDESRDMKDWTWLHFLTRGPYSEYIKPWAATYPQNHFSSVTAAPLWPFGDNQTSSSLA